MKYLVTTNTQGSMWATKRGHFVLDEFEVGTDDEAVKKSKAYHRYGAVIRLFKEVEIKK